MHKHNLYVGFDFPEVPHLNGGQALLAVALLNTNVDVVLGVGGLSVLLSRIRKSICASHIFSTGTESRDAGSLRHSVFMLPPKWGLTQGWQARACTAAGSKSIGQESHQ